MFFMYDERELRVERQKNSEIVVLMHNIASSDISNDDALVGLWCIFRAFYVLNTLYLLLIVHFRSRLFSFS